MDTHVDGARTQAPPVASGGFTTAGLAPALQLEAWDAFVGRVNAVAPLAPAAPGFAAANRSWELGGLLVTHNLTPAMRIRRTARQSARDGLDHWVLRVLRRGQARMATGDRLGDLLPGSLALSSLALGYESEYGPAEWVTLCLPRDLHPELSAGLARLGPGPIPGTAAALLARHLLALVEALPTATEAEAPALAAALRAMVGACALHCPGTGALPRAIEARLRERVDAAIADQLGSPGLGPAQLAGALGLSRSALYRLMAPEGGVARRIRRERLARVHAQLTDPVLAHRPIAALAVEAGFPDAALFHRSFRRAYGCTPGEARAAALTGAPPPTMRRPPPAGRPDLAALLGAAPG